jgi:hypothetical protein
MALTSLQTYVVEGCKCHVNVFLTMTETDCQSAVVFIV